MIKPRVVAILSAVLASTTSAAAEQNIKHTGNMSFSLSAEASSEPVPIDQMIEGWEQDADPGEYAYADMSLVASASYQNFTLNAERRWFYSLKFSPDTTAVYLDAEFGIETQQDRDLNLVAKVFQAR